jgi:hypothetical protein
MPDIRILLLGAMALMLASFEAPPSSPPRASQPADITGSIVRSATISAHPLGKVGDEDMKFAK